MSAKRPVTVVEYREPGSRSSATGRTDDGGSRKRTRDDRDAEKAAFMSGDVSKATAASMGRIKSAGRRDAGGSSDKDQQFDIDKIWRSVAKLGASAFAGKDKKAWEASQLKDQGLKLKHKEKMPFKMYQGVMKARKERAAKAEDEAKLAGLVTGRGAGSSKAAKAAKRREERQRDNDDDITPDNIRGPVMFLGKR